MMSCFQSGRDIDMEENNGYTTMVQFGAAVGWAASVFKWNKPAMGALPTSSSG